MLFRLIKVNVASHAASLGQILEHLAAVTARIVLAAAAGQVMLACLMISCIVILCGGSLMS